MPRPHAPSSRKHEMHTSEVPIENDYRATSTSVDDDHDDHDSHIHTDKALHAGMLKGYADQLAFNEEPVTIMFSSGHERFSAPFVDAFVMGKGIEVLTDDRRWIEVKQVPVEVEITTKRKYVEVFARAKHTDVKAYHTGGGEDGGDPVNHTIRKTNLKYPFTVIEDKNPIGREWIKKILTGRA